MGPLYHQSIEGLDVTTFYASPVKKGERIFFT